MGKKPDISKTYHERSRPKNVSDQLEEPVEGWPVPLQVIPPISKPEEEGMPMFELDNVPYQNSSPEDEVQPDFSPGNDMHGRNLDDSTEKGERLVRGTMGTIGGGVTPIVEENTTDRGTKSLGRTDEIEIEDEAIANILDGLRKAKKGQLDADKLSEEADKGLKKRRLRKGIGRKRTRASVAAAKEVMKEGTENTKIDLEELESSAEKKKVAKKGKGKVQGGHEKQKKKMDESGYTRKMRSKIIHRNDSSSEAEDDLAYSPMVDPPKPTDRPRNSGGSSGGNTTKPDHKDTSFTSSSDLLGNIIIPIVLRSTNYDEWAHSIRLSFTSRRKITFLERSKVKPINDPEKLFDWRCIYTLLVQWVLNTIDPSIKTQISFYEKVYRL
ncbi:hypothetical protein LIER_17101 [Lithospermum erythrorhizon]|uniref:Retrotransposon Copia-like N-terminal domain-containing protein n=1 Tax=Lithospermum erythrorhizon TaxID=34254 RepID=A0AAV3QD72_LITER